MHLFIVQDVFISLFGVLRHFQHCTGHITMVSFIGRGNQYIQLVKVLYCTLQTIGKQLPTFPHKVQGLNCWPQRWEASVLPLHRRGPCNMSLHIHVFEIHACMHGMYACVCLSCVFITEWGVRGSRYRMQILSNR